MRSHSTNTQATHGTLEQPYLTSSPITRAIHGGTVRPERHLSFHAPITRATNRNARQSRFQHPAQSRKPQTPNLQKQLLCPESRGRLALWSFFWERWRFGGGKPVLSKKMGFPSPRKRGF